MKTNGKFVKEGSGQARAVSQRQEPGGDKEISTVYVLLQGAGLNIQNGWQFLLIRVHFLVLAQE